MNTTKLKSKPALNNEYWITLDSQVFGGIETHVLELAAGLIQFKQNVRVVLLTEYANSQPIISKLKSADIPFNFVSELSSGKPHTNILKHFYSAIQQHQPKLIHAHGYKASIISRLACLQCKWHSQSHPPAQMTTYHAGETPKGKVRFYDMLDRFSAFMSNRNFAVSHDIAHKIPDKTVVLNNFVSLPPYPKHFGKNIAYVGRLSHEKAPDRYLALAQYFPNDHFHLYGSGPMAAELKPLATENVLFHGHIDDMNAVWDNIGVLLITSRFEGLPMAALEAMSRGIPVISTNVGAISSLIEHDKNGWIGSNVEALRQSLNSWLTLSEVHKAEVRKKARQTIEHHFSIQAVIPQYLEQYEDVLNR